MADGIKKKIQAKRGPQPMMDLDHGKPWSREHFEKTEPDVAECMFLIDADAYATYMLWNEWSAQSANRNTAYPNVHWSDRSARGPAIAVGMLDGRPVVLSMKAATIEGIPVCFIHACSQVVDRKMVDDFLSIVMPGVGRTDPANFHHFTHKVDELLAAFHSREEAIEIASASKPGAKGGAKAL